MRTFTIVSSHKLHLKDREKLEKEINLSEKEEIFFRYSVDSNIKGIRLFEGEKLLDYSTKGMINSIRHSLAEYLMGLSEGLSVADIPLLLKKKTEELKSNPKDFSICGKVISCADGIVLIEGLSNCKYKEIVLIGEKGYALVMNLGIDTIGGILLSAMDTATYGDIVYTTGKVIEVPVGMEYIGRVVDSLGKPLDGRAPIITQQSMPIERQAPRIIDREKVNEPLYTGVLAIDAMIPIGKGQRELIIGDRQTGKTALITDAIINQKGKNVLCIYVAIGQRMATVNKLVRNLETHGAMEYTTIVLSTAADNAASQYIAPYTGAALADYFMYQGKDVLIAYDDLSKHAIAYRTISLLLKRPAGREAFPGDIFYIHSRLLERAAKLKKSLGGGSITALPVIETQAGDISAYIPTNVISITDGQIYLEKDLFTSGIRPAINVGLSVSRIGGAAQSKTMRVLSSKLRLDIAHYRELALFAQFGSSLDSATKDVLANGRRIEEVISQVDSSPYDYQKEIIYLFCIAEKMLKDIPLRKIGSFLILLYNHILATNKNVIMNICTQDLNESLRNELTQVINSFISIYSEGKQ